VSLEYIAIMSYLSFSPLMGQSLFRPIFVGKLLKVTRSATIMYMQKMADPLPHLLPACTLPMRR